jgi:hypothetical protein
MTMDWRKVDALLAANLFGYREIMTLESGYLVGLHPRQIEYGMTPHETIPFYSSNWAGMGEVVERMRARGYSLNIEIFAGMDGVVKAKLHFADSKGMGIERADTAPRAAALAACKALGLEVPHE